jgi:DNA-binding response OmpR family regulator
VTKPRGTAELLARVQVLLRSRTAAPEPVMLPYADLRLDGERLSRLARGPAHTL